MKGSPFSANLVLYQYLERDRERDFATNSCYVLDHLMWEKW